MSDEEDSDDPRDYTYVCAFCYLEVGTDDDLKKHMESTHLHEMFIFLCGECGFHANGPRQLKEHIVNTHVQSAAGVMTMAILDLEQVMTTDNATQQV